MLPFVTVLEYIKGQINGNEYHAGETARQYKNNSGCSGWTNI